MFRLRPAVKQTLSLVRYMSKERAGKSVKPGAAIVISDEPHRVMKTIQGKTHSYFNPCRHEISQEREEKAAHLSKLP